MSHFNLFAKLAQFMRNSNSKPMFKPQLTRKDLRALRPPRYKPAFSCGYRGWPKTSTPPGSIPAPTIDQVRHLERKYGQKIHVKLGVMYFATDGRMFTRDEAELRQAA